MDKKKDSTIDKLASVKGTFNDDILAMVQQATVVSEITSDYLDLSEGETGRYIVIGETSFKDENGEEVKAIRVYDVNDKKTYVSASTVLVNSCLLAIKEIPSDRIIAIEVICKGKPKGKKYIDYTVNLLG